MESKADILDITISCKRLENACLEIDLGDELQGVVLSRGSELLARGGQLNESQAKAITNQVNLAWDERLRTALIQYTLMADSGVSLLLYTRPTPDSLVTLVAWPGTPMAQLRQQVKQLLYQLTNGSHNQQPEMQSNMVAAAVLPAPQADPEKADGDHRTLMPPIAGGDSPNEPTSPLTTLTHSQPWNTALSILAFLLPRLVFGAVILVAIIYISYLGLEMAGGTDFVPAAMEAIPKTVAYIQRLLNGSMGFTTAGSDTILPVPVTQVIRERLPRSLGLIGISILFASLIAIPLDIRSAKRQSQSSLIILITTIIGISIPSFFAAFLLQTLATTYTRQVGRALLPVGGFGWDSHLILPVIVLAARPLAQITRITFVSVGAVLGMDYVRTARSKGLRGIQVMVTHVMRNAAIPILTTIGISLRFVLASLPVVEFYFGWPGVGATLLKGIAQQDANQTIGLVYSDGISPSQGDQEAPVVRLFWEGWELHASKSTNTVENISAENLEKTGRVLAMAFMILGREVDY